MRKLLPILLCVSFMPGGPDYAEETKGAELGGRADGPTEPAWSDPINGLQCRVVQLPGPFEAGIRNCFSIQFRNAGD